MAANTRQPDPSALFLDRSRRRIEEDELGRKGFVRSVWHALRNHDASEAIVISIQAPWGDGKTTLKDMVVTLEETEGKREKLLFVHFNPWEWAAQNQVATAFFGELAKQIEECIGKGVGKRVREALGKTVRALPHFFGLFEAGSQGAAMATAPTSPPLAILAAAGAELAKKGRELSEQVVNHQTGLSAIDTPSVQLVKISVRKQFEEFKKKTHRNIVVFIDDIDRLSADEIRQVLQLVKVNADFPGLIFVLLYDKAYVERRLRRHFGSDAARFLEKIVQVELQLPPAAQNQLYRSFEDRVRRVLANRSPYLALYEESRLKEAFDAWFRIHLTNPRKFGRLLSSWAFRLDVFDSKTAEVNPVDLLILEGLMVFEPPVHRELSSRYPELFYLDFNDVMMDALEKRRRSPGEPSRRMRVLDELARSSSGPSSTEVLKALKLLLGVRGSDFADISDSEKAERVKARRFSYPRFARRYFRLTIDAGDISSDTIQQLGELVQHPARFTGLLTQLEEDGTLIDALDQLLAQKPSAPPEPSLLLAHILDWWETRITTAITPRSDGDLAHRLHAMLRHLLGALEGESRLEILTACVRQSNAPFAAIKIAFAESSERHRRGNERPADTSGILTSDGNRILCEEVARRLPQHFKNTPPQGRPHEVEACWWLLRFAGAWRRDIGDVLLQTPGGILSLLVGIFGDLGESRRPEGRMALLKFIEPTVLFENLDRRAKALRGEIFQLDSRAPTVFEALDDLRRVQAPQPDPPASKESDGNAGS